MRIYDITLTLTPDLPIWPGDPPVTLQRIADMQAGDDNNVSQLSLCVHAGTHVDAPSHFLGDDAIGVDRIPLNMLTGRAYVLHLPDEVDLIDSTVLKKADIPPRSRRLLFKTRNSALWASGEKQFQTDFVALSADGAQYLVERGVRLVGVDYLSVAPFESSLPTHKILLEAGVIIVEGLDLSGVSQGRYTLYCLPLKIGGSDGAPARAMLVGV